MYEELVLAMERLERGQWAQATALARRIGTLAAFGTGLRMTMAGRALADDLGLPRSSSPAVLVSAENANGTARYLEELASLRGASAASVFREGPLSATGVVAEEPLGRHGHGGLGKTL